MPGFRDYMAGQGGPAQPQQQVPYGVIAMRLAQQAQQRLIQQRLQQMASQAPQMPPQGMPQQPQMPQLPARDGVPLAGGASPQQPQMPQMPQADPEFEAGRQFGHFLRQQR